MFRRDASNSQDERAAHFRTPIFDGYLPEKCVVCYLRILKSEMQPGFGLN